MLLHTAPLSPWHSQVCNNAGFENVNLFQCNRSIREQFEHNTYFAFAHAWFCLWEKHEVNVESCNQLNWGTWKYAKHRYVHTPTHTHTQTQTWSSYVSSLPMLGATPIHIRVTTFPRISDNPAFTISNLQTTLLPMPTSNQTACLFSR